MEIVKIKNSRIPELKNARNRRTVLAGIYFLIDAHLHLAKTSPWGTWHKSSDNGQMQDFVAFDTILYNEFEEHK